MVYSSCTAALAAPGLEDLMARYTPTIAEARGMREALIRQSPSGGGPYKLLDLESEPDRRVIGSVYADAALSAMGRR